MERKKILSSLFLLSIALITFELYVIRTFSVGNWSNFGSLIISTALLGFGVSGTLLTFLQKKIVNNHIKWLYFSSLAFMVTLVLSYIIAQQVKFDPIHLGTNSNQVLFIGLYYLLYGIPFFCGALFIGVSFLALKNNIYKLYFWNMLGSGLGGFVLIALMFILPPAKLILPIVFLALTANLLIGSSKDRKRISLPNLIISGLTFITLLFVLFFAGDIRVSEYKAISTVKHFSDELKVHHSYSPAGELTVYASPSLHFAPGLSDTASSLKELPNQPFWGLYIDGNGPIGIMGKLDEEAAVYMDYLPMAAPYEILQNPKNLMVNLGGGINAQVAKYKGASEIVVYEQNPAIIDLLANDPVIAGFTGNLLDDPIISVYEGETRVHCTEKPDYYDLIEISLIDSIGLSDTGGYPIVENFTYTEEAISDYMSALNNNGILSITVWNRLDPPRNILKLLTTIVSSMRKDITVRYEGQNISDLDELINEEIRSRIFMFDLLRSTATILVKKTAFEKAELYELNRFCTKRSFEVVHYYHPDLYVPVRDVKLDAILTTYRDHFENKESTSANIKFTNNDLYYTVLQALIAGEEKKVYKEYIFDIRPMTDKRPYYSGYLKLNEIGIYLDQMQEVSEEWAYILILGILVQAIVFSLLIILIPVLTSWKSLFKQKAGIIRVILYYSCLGLGYMLVEIFLIQRLVFFLSNPIYSVSIVITTMLIISGLGNLSSQYMTKSRIWRIRIAVIGIVATMLFYIFALSPILNAMRSEAMILRIFISILLIAPAAFFLGIPFSNGLSALTEKRPHLLPWAWGMNGGLSVAGAALAQIISVSLGFNLLLIMAMTVYIAVAFTFSANEISA